MSFALLYCRRTPWQFRDVVVELSLAWNLSNPPYVWHFCQTILASDDYDLIRTHMELWGFLEVSLGDTRHVVAMLNKGHVVCRAGDSQAVLDKLEALPSRLRVKPECLGRFDVCVLEPWDWDLFAGLEDWQ